MIKVLVTGGCGFIGSNLVKRLVDMEWQVDVVDDMSSGDLDLLGDLPEGARLRVVPAVSFLGAYEEHELENRLPGEVMVLQDDFASLEMLDRVSRGRYDFIFHQAAIPRVLYSVENPAITTDVNVSKTAALLEASIGSVKRVIFASSSSVYGGPDILPISEETQKNPKSPYAWQKSAIEDLSKLFCNLYDIDIVCLRYFNVFGPGQLGNSAYSTAVSAWCHRTKDANPLRSDGDGTQSRDLCYIDNVVDANVLAATASREGGFNGRCYNIACGDRTSNKHILEYFKQHYPYTIVQDSPWRKGDVMHTQACIDRAKSELGYEPKIRFWDGFEMTLKWWGI